MLHRQGEPKNKQTKGGRQIRRSIRDRLKEGKANDSTEMATFLLELMGMFGRPRGIRTDGGPEMDNKLIDAFMKLIGVQRHVTLAYRPQSHGII